MKITDFFDKTVCINLDRRFDRWSECVTEFEKNKLDGIERFRAVDGKDLQQLPKGFLTQSRLALVLTNMLILDKAIEEDYDSILILEDDVEFTNQVTNMKSFFDSLPEDWDMLYFGGNHNTHVGYEPPTIINDKVCKLHNTFSTHCVAINKKAFKEVLERLKKCDNALDVIYVELQSKLNVYSFYPMIATQRVSFSDIENKLTDYKWLIK
jgi:GR25 family glycosyltransferase involved in LPS biosynthesis